jgi:putative tricarboxylic transport membrane protein
MIWFTQLKPQLLIPIVLAITMVGAYAFRQEAFDLRLFLVFGLLGIVMRLGDYPRVPLLIGLVLGPLCEQNLLLSLKIGNDSVSYFWSSSVGKGLVLLLLLIVGGLIWSSIRRSGGTPNSRQTARPGSLVG